MSRMVSLIRNGHAEGFPRPSNLQKSLTISKYLNSISITVLLYFHAHASIEPLSEKTTEGHGDGNVHPGKWFANSKHRALGHFS